MLVVPCVRGSRGGGRRGVGGSVSDHVARWVAWMGVGGGGA